MKGHVAKDHVHLFVSIPPQVTISSIAAMAEREDLPPPDRGVPAFEEAVLGTTPVGARLFLLQFRERDGRRDGQVHRRAECQSGRGLPSRWLSPKVHLLLEARVVRDSFCRPPAGIGLTGRCYQSHRLEAVAWAAVPQHQKTRSHVNGSCVARWRPVFQVTGTKNSSRSERKFRNIRQTAYQVASHSLDSESVRPNPETETVRHRKFKGTRQHTSCSGAKPVPALRRLARLGGAAVLS